MEDNSFVEKLLQVIDVALKLSKKNFFKGFDYHRFNSKIV